MTFDLLIKLSPLVIATLHGYLAAWLTLKMVFHPRRPVFLFGRKLPFTPGLVPKQRERFIEGFSTVIADRILNIEAITDEIMQLNIESEITAIARSEYLHHSKSESTMHVIVEHIKERLYHLRDSVETRWEIARSMRQIIEAEFERRLGVMRRVVTGYFLDDELIYRIVGISINQMAESIAESLYVRSTIEQTMSQIPETIFQQAGASGQSTAIQTFMKALKEKLDLRAMIIRRLNALSSEEIEALIMESASREIRAMIRLGTAVGLVVGILQTALNFI